MTVILREITTYSIYVYFFLYIYCYCSFYLSFKRSIDHKIYLIFSLKEINDGENWRPETGSDALNYIYVDSRPYYLLKEDSYFATLQLPLYNTSKWFILQWIFLPKWWFLSLPGLKVLTGFFDHLLSVVCLYIFNSLR